MLRSRGSTALACALSALAGYVDGIGFLYLGGMFVSFMSGNSTRMAVNIAAGDWRSAAESLGLIALFVIGAACGTLIVRGRSVYGQCRVLLAEAALLAMAALGSAFGWQDFAIVPIVLAMGMENTVSLAGGGSGLGLTYMTGALVKVGQLVAASVSGKSPRPFLPNLLLWLALVAGAVCGALAYHWIHLAAIWFAAATALALAAMVGAAARRAIDSGGGLSDLKS